MIWLKRVAMIFSYVMLDIRSISFQKYKNKNKSSSVICNSHPEPYELQVWTAFPHMQLVFSLSFVKLLWPFVRITSYAHDQDHVHVHSHAIFLHLEDSKYIPHPSTNKTPWHIMTLSLQVTWNVWAIQKEIKDAYPKKVCHMPTRHVKKKDAYPKKVCHMPRRHDKKKKKKKI